MAIFPTLIVDKRNLMSKLLRNSDYFHFIANFIITSTSMLLYSIPN